LCFPVEKHLSLRRPVVMTDTNGFKDPSQNILDFALVEMGGTIAQAADPNRGALYLIKDYCKAYSSSRNSCIAVTVAGGAVLASGLALSLPLTSPFILAGFAVTAMGGLHIGHHATGVTLADQEARFLEKYPELLASLAYSCTKGIPSRVAAVVYRELLIRHNQGRPITQDDIDRSFTQACNSAVTSYKAGDRVATAFNKGEVLDYQADPDDFEEEQEDQEPEVAMLPEGTQVPFFLRSAEPEAMASGPASQGYTVSAPPKIIGDLAPEKPRALVDRVISVNGFLAPRIMIGASRSGKSQLASDCISEVRNRYPDSTIYYLSAGFKVGEDDWYWRAADVVAGYKLKDCKPEEIDRAYTHWVNVLEAFRDNSDYSAEKPKVLIVDEANSIEEYSSQTLSGPQVKQLISNFLVASGSMGAKDGYIVWALAPVGDMAGLGVTRGKVSSLNPVFTGVVGANWNDLVHRTASTNGLAPKNKPEGFKEGQRVVAIGGRWEALPPTKKLALGLPDRSPPPEPWQIMAASTMAQAGYGVTYDKPGTILESGVKVSIPSNVWQVLEWAYQKLTRLPEGLTPGRLWSDAPDSISKLGRSFFDTCITEAIAVGYLQQPDTRIFPGEQMTWDQYQQARDF
jgi:hypothetical protein